jgi:hypothetical protein
LDSWGRGKLQNEYASSITSMHGLGGIVEKDEMKEGERRMEENPETGKRLEDRNKRDFGCF